MPNEPPVLTAEQINVLSQLARGLVYKQIAYACGRKPLTVRRMARRAGDALGARTPMHMIALFVARYPLPPEPTWEENK